jgi:hypothetical protein
MRRSFPAGAVPTVRCYIDVTRESGGEEDFDEDDKPKFPRRGFVP